MDTRQLSVEVPEADDSILNAAGILVLMQKLRAKARWLIIVAIILAVIGVLRLFSIIRDAVSRGFSPAMLFRAAVAVSFLYPLSH